MTLPLNSMKDQIKMWVYIHHIHIHAPPNTTKRYLHHQIPPKNKICLVGLTSELYERPDQYERFLLNNMFLVLFSEKCWKVLKSTEKHSAFQWKVQLMKAQCFSVKSATLFSEKCWKVQCFSVKSTVDEKCSAFQWKALRFSSKFMSFWVITKYRSFVYIRKTKQHVLKRNPSK